MSGPQVLLEPDVAQAVAVMIHELATNAAKYGALSVNHAGIELTWSDADRKLHLIWTKNDGPRVEQPSRSGFGSKIIDLMIAGLKGNVAFDWRPEGVICRIVLPY